MLYKVDPTQKRLSVEVKAGMGKKNITGIKQKTLAQRITRLKKGRVSPKILQLIKNLKTRIVMIIVDLDRIESAKEDYNIKPNG